MAGVLCVKIVYKEKSNFESKEKTGLQEDVVKEKMNFNEKEKIYQEMIKNSPHLIEKFIPKKIEKSVESPIEKLRNLRKDKIKDYNMKGAEGGEMKRKLLPKVKQDDVKLIAYELKLRFILKKIDIGSIEKVRRGWNFDSFLNF